MIPTHFIVSFLNDDARVIGWLNGLGGIGKLEKVQVFDSVEDAERAIEDSEVELEARIEGTTIGK